MTEIADRYRRIAAVFTKRVEQVPDDAWDISRAAGLDETLDPVEVHRLFAAIEPMDEMLRESGQYGPRFAVRDGADEQTMFLAFIGRVV